MWRKDVDPATGDEVVSRVGWWGNDYDLLSNNCCFLTDHLLKILVNKPLPVRAEPPSLLNLSSWKENKERRSFAKTGSGHTCDKLRKTTFPFLFLQGWIFSLAKIGDGLAHGVHFLHDAAAEGVHKAIAAVEHTIGGYPQGVEPAKKKGCLSCCGGRPEPEPAPEPAPEPDTGV
jgi:hypothetical protein